MPTTTTETVTEEKLPKPAEGEATFSLGEFIGRAGELGLDAGEIRSAFYGKDDDTQLTAKTVKDRVKALQKAVVVNEELADLNDEG